MVDVRQRQEILNDIKSRIQPLPASAMFVQTHRVNPFIDPSSEEGKPCHCQTTSGKHLNGHATSESGSSENLDAEAGSSRSQSSPPPPPHSPPPPHKPRFERVSWCYPSTSKERLRYAAFRHFWESGLFVTNGVKFGGDFLVYPGDPTRFHSFFVVQVSLILAV